MSQEELPLGERFAHEPDFAVLEIAQTAMDQTCGPSRCASGKVVAFEQQHAQTTPGGVPRDCRAIDATADDGDIEIVDQRGS